MQHDSSCQGFHDLSWWAFNNWVYACIFGPVRCVYTISQYDLWQHKMEVNLAAAYPFAAAMTTCSLHSAAVCSGSMCLKAIVGNMLQCVVHNLLFSALVGSCHIPQPACMTCCWHLTDLSCQATSQPTTQSARLDCITLLHQLDYLQLHSPAWWGYELAKQSPRIFKCAIWRRHTRSVLILGLRI